jgi:hypothetical protein
LFGSGIITYYPENLFDGDNKTCWCTQSNGIGDFIIYKIPYGIKGIRIVNGIAKNNGVYFAYNRVKQLFIGVIAKKFYIVKEGEEDFDICKGINYALNNLTISDTVIELKDNINPQKILFSDVNHYVNGKISSKGSEFWNLEDLRKSRNLYLVVGIQDIFKGNKYNNTCISEIEIIK